MAVEELNRARLETERLAADAAAAKAALGDRAAEPASAPRCGPRAPGVDQHPHRRHRAVRPGRQRPRDARRPAPAAPALQGLRVRVAEGAGGPGGRVPGRLARRRGVRRAASTTSATSPTRRPARSRSSPGSTTPGVLKPGFFAEVTLATGTHAGRGRRPRERRPGQRARLRRLRRRRTARRRRAAGPDRPADRRRLGRDRLRARRRRDDRHRGLGPARRRHRRRGRRGRAGAGRRPPRGAVRDGRRAPRPSRRTRRTIATGMTLADISIRNHVFAWILMVALIGFGILCYTGFGDVFKGLGISQNPDVDFPIVNVGVSLGGRLARDHGDRRRRRPRGRLRDRRGRPADVVDRPPGLGRT